MDVFRGLKFTQYKKNKILSSLKENNLELVYVLDNRKHIVVMCIKHRHHIFKMMIKHLVSSNYTCCIYCSNRRMHPREIYEDIVNICNNKNIDVVSMLKFKGATTKFRLKCRIDGYEWEASYNYMKSLEFGCKKCANQLQIPMDKIISNLNEINMDLIDGLPDKYNIFTKVYVRCRECGLISTKSIGDISTRKSRCKRCYGNILSGLERWEFANKIAKSRNYELLWTPDDFTTVDNRYMVLCKTHNHTWSPQYKLFASKNLKNRTGCPLCSVSKMEIQVIDYLKSKNLKFEYEKTFDDLLSPRCKNLSYDFYLPELNILIECQGEQHYNKMWDDKDGKKLKRQILHDKIKKLYANKNGYTFLEIRYDEDVIEKLEGGIKIYE